MYHHKSAICQSDPPGQITFNHDSPVHSPPWLMSISQEQNVFHSYLRVLKVLTVLTLLKKKMSKMSLETQGKLFTMNPNKIKTQAAYTRCIVAQSKQTYSNRGIMEASKKRLGQSQTETQQGKHQTPNLYLHSLGL